MKHNEEILEKAKELGVDLSYSPLVIMDDIRELPDEFWHESRLTGFGGSDEGALYGVGYNSKEMILAQKIMGVSSSPDASAQFKFDYGHLMETLLLKQYASERGMKYLCYKEYFVTVRSEDDLSSFGLKSFMKDVWSMSTKDKDKAKALKDELEKIYDVDFFERDTNEPKDIREITKEEHELYDSMGIVCVDRRQYRHSQFPHVYGDCDGICIEPDGNLIGLECKTFASSKVDAFKSGIYGKDGFIELGYYYQVQHYMEVLNLDRFDVVACCDNNTANYTITTVYRDLELGRELMKNCEKVWENEVENLEDIPENCMFPVKELARIREMNLKKIEEPLSKPKLEELDAQYANLVKDYYEAYKEYEKANEEVKKLDEKRKNLQEKVLAAMEQKQKVKIEVDGDDYYVNVTVVNKETFDKKKYLLNHPESTDEFKKYTKKSTEYRVKPSVYVKN